MPLLLMRESLREERNIDYTLVLNNYKMKTPRRYIASIWVGTLLIAASCSSSLAPQPSGKSISPQATDMPNESPTTDPISYLALGDSYTIGEGVPNQETYPVLLTKLLAAKGISISSPKVIATTGWTTAELQQGIQQAGIEGNRYELVTLLIGVNNQYRGLSLESYRQELSELLDQAIAFADGKTHRVKVISIPDWSVSDFAKQQGVDKEKVSSEIDAFNASKQEICLQRSIYYIDITNEYRQIGHQPEHLVEDGLHPSGIIYASWANQLLPEVHSSLGY